MVQNETQNKAAPFDFGQDNDLFRTNEERERCALILSRCFDFEDEEFELPLNAIAERLHATESKTFRYVGRLIFAGYLDPVYFADGFRPRPPKFRLGDKAHALRRYGANVG